MLRAAEVGSGAMTLQYTQKPQDGSADAIINLNVAPSYVTYSHRWGVA